jgi:FMN reductase
MWLRSTVKPLIVGIGGTTRVGSISEQALRYALKIAEEAGAETRAIAGPSLQLDHYNAGNPARSAGASELVEAMRRADGLIISTPSYHGSISGHVKNALDYAEDLRADPRPYFDGRAVGVIVCADGPQAMGATIGALRSVVHALRGWPTPFAACVNSVARPFGEDGAVERDTAQALELVTRQVVEFARMHLVYRELTDVNDLQSMAVSA